MSTPRPRIRTASHRADAPIAGSASCTCGSAPGARSRRCCTASPGLVMNHRFGEGAWPQGDSVEAGRMVLAVPLCCTNVTRGVVFVAAARRMDSTRRSSARELRVTRNSASGICRVATHACRGRWNTSPGRLRAREVKQHPPKPACHRQRACTRASAEAWRGRCSPTASPSACCCSECPGCGCGRADAGETVGV